VRVDFHSHTRESDGALAPDALVARMRARGVAMFSITDHDTVRAYDGLVVEGATLITGIEINTSWNGDDVHVLGYGFPLGDDTPVARTLATNREHRRERVGRMVTGLNAAGYPITVAGVMEASGGGHTLGRPHVAKALIAGGFVPDVATAFRELLTPGKPGYQPTPYLTPHQAVEVIARSGGVPVLAHPGRLKDESILGDLVDAGLLGLEVFYAAHSAAQTAHFRGRAAHYGLAMSAGADFHDPRWSAHGVGVDVDAGDLKVFLEAVQHD
jgi:predicted metal-dependent phosphoesterase TrpH